MRYIKGPWKTLEYGASSIAVIGSDYRIAVVMGRHNKETQANAQLIAAAPELLEALEVAIAQLNHDVPGSCYATGPLTGDPVQDLIVCPGCVTLKKVRAAIAKAKGGE